MDRKLKLKQLLEKENFDAFLKKDISIKDSDMYYLTQMKFPDPAVYLQLPEKAILMISTLESKRAEKEADVEEVVNSTKYRKAAEESNALGAIKELLNQNKVERIGVTEDFDLGLARKLEEEFEIEVIDNPVMESREQKSAKEIEKIKKVQRTTEEAMKYLESILSDSEISDNRLYLDGKLLTSKKVKAEVEKFLLDHESRNPEGMIITCGEATGDPHKRESGPLKPNEPIIADIFPRHTSMYFGDMTRTFVKGEASDEIKRMKEAVLESQQAALEVLEKGAGVKANEVHNKVCDILENHGYETLRDNDTESGFIHSTGHAVGLELHEPPRISGNDTELKAGHLLTIEPGLYVPELGGLRIEDMVLIKEDGYENFNTMDKDLEID